jgi:hypothetical protein
VNYAHLTVYLAALAMAGMWTWFLFRQCYPPHPTGRTLTCRRHKWETVEDYGTARKCRCRRCGHVALISVNPLQKP